MNIFCPCPTAGKFPCVIARAILVVSSQDFVARVKSQGMSNDVYPMRRVGNIDQVVCVGIEVFSKRLAGSHQKTIQFVSKKKHRLCVPNASATAGTLQKPAWGRAKGAVIEKKLHQSQGEDDF